MDTVSVLFIVVGVVALAWAIREEVTRRRRASRELAARKAAQTFDPRTLWLDDARRERIARNVMEQVTKHHDWN